MQRPEPCPREERAQVPWAAEDAGAQRLGMRRAGQGCMCPDGAPGEAGGWRRESVRQSVAIAQARLDSAGDSTAGFAS